MADSSDDARDARWVERIRQGDTAGFDALVRAYYTSLFDFARSYTRSATAAEDLVQDVLLAVWERRAAWQPKGSARAYLFRAVRNRALNYVRDRAVRQSGDVEPDALPTEQHASPEGAFHYGELLRDYRAAVEELPERRRLVFRLSRLYGLTYQEIADVLDVSINTIRTQMSAALKHVRERLEEHL